MEDAKVLRSYVRGSKNRKVGVVVGTVIDDKIAIGYSKAKLKEDKFFPGFGFNLAMKVARDSSASDFSMFEPPKSTLRNVRDMIIRSKKYFKQGKLSPALVEAFNRKLVTTREKKLLIREEHVQ